MDLLINHIKEENEKARERAAKGKWVQKLKK